MCEFYLVGLTFVVYTDHKTFRALVDERIRWINYLENIINTFYEKEMF